MRPARVLVLGIGNLLMTDEGVGVHVLEALHRKYILGAGVESLDGGTSGMELLPALEGTGLLIVIDAVRMGKVPGTVKRFAEKEIPAYFKTKLSPHQVGLADMLAALVFKGAAPGRVVLIGVEPDRLSLGMELTPKVRSAVEQALGLVVEELAASGFPCRLRT